jgi:hypothetical protein
MTEKDFEGSGCGIIEVLAQHLHGGAEKNHKNLCQDIQCPK